MHVAETKTEREETEIKNAKKKTMISLSNTVSDPWTMVIEIIYANIATITVFTSRGAEYITSATVSMSQTPISHVIIQSRCFDRTTDRRKDSWIRYSTYPEVCHAQKSKKRS